MILKFTSILENNYTGDCTWHVIADVEDVQYGYYKDKNECVLKQDEIYIKPDNFITYYKTPKTVGSICHNITLTGAEEAYLMTNEGKTIEKIR